MSTDRIKVLYIGGSGRSGSTLLDRLLGELRGFHAVGEIWDIWKKCFTENELCGCGQPFRECEFWRAVVDEAFGGFDGIDVERVKVIRRTLESQRFLPLVIYPHLRSAEQQQLVEEYLQVVKQLYAAIHSVTDSQVIIDSSKGPRYAMLLSEIPEIDLRLLHLVRDSRAVVYSWQKKMVKPEVYWKTQYMDRPDPVSAAVFWNITNMLTQSFRTRRAAYLFARYEDLVESPRTWIDRLVRFVGEEEQDYDRFVCDKTVTLTAHHTASGNPNRFRQGTIEVRRDDEWQRKMPKPERYLVTAMTLPLLRKYGYLNGHGHETTARSGRN